MRRWFLFALLISSSTALHATMTVAWKMPAGDFHSQLSRSDLARKLAQPPGPSAFLQPGDELWDITPILASANLSDPVPFDTDPFAPATGAKTAAPTIPAPVWSGEWAVWDARSQMVVARGSRNEILAVERQLHLEEHPVQARTRLEIISHDPKNNRSVTLVSRSGEQATAEVNGWKTTLTTTISQSPRLIDLQLATTWPGLDPDTAWELKTAVSLRNENRIMLARQGDFELWAAVEIDGTDGKPVSKIRWIEDGGSTSPWSFQHQDDKLLIESLDSDRSIGWYPHAFRRIGPDALETLLATQPMDAPPELHSRIHGRFLDLRPYLAKEGHPLATPGSFAGYDPMADMIVVVSTPSDIAATGEAILDQTSDCPPVNVTAETNSAAGGWLLLGRSGETQQLILRKGQDALRSFELEPTIGAANGLLDLHYALKLSPQINLKSTCVINRDQSIRIGEFQSPGGSELPVEITIHLQEIYR